jgi:GNAT superfamily N-acetyltransferase
VLDVSPLSAGFFAQLLPTPMRERWMAQGDDVVATGASDATGAPVGAGMALLIDPGVARLDWLLVAADARRAGVGRKLLARLTERVGARRFEARWARPVASMDPRAVDDDPVAILLTRAGWSPPEIAAWFTRYSMERIRHSFMHALPLPAAPLRVASWGDVPTEAVHAAHARGGFPDHCNPLAEMPGVADPHCSVGLLSASDLVGWCIVRRVRRTHALVHMLYVEPPYRGDDAARRLVGESARRSVATGYTHGQFNVASNHPRMVDLVARLWPHVERVDCVRTSTLDPA